MDADLNHDRSRPNVLLSRCHRNRMSDNTIRIAESVEDLDDLASVESSRAKLNRLAVLKLYALFVRSGETEPVPAIARSVGVAEDTVRKWLEIYSQSGLSGLLSGRMQGGAPKSRKRASQKTAPKPPENADAAIASAPLSESDTDVAREDPDAEVVAAEGAFEAESAHVIDQPDVDTERPIDVANVADRYRLLFDETEEDEWTDFGSSAETSPRATSRSSSFKDEVRLRARAGRRAIGRATKRLLRRGDAARAGESATSGEESMLPTLEPTLAPTGPRAREDALSASSESASDIARARRSVESSVDSRPFARGKRSDQSAEALNGAWVLVAETDDMISSIIRHRLEKQGANVVVAPDGMEVVSTLWRRDFDLLVTAVALPGLDGFEITRWVRDSSQHMRIPVMVMSWPGNESDLVRAFEAGADDFMYKPFSPVELITRLKRLRRSGAAGGATTAASDAA